MRARAHVEVPAHGTRAVRLRSEPPLVLRETWSGLVLVAGAGGPLGGDDLALDVRVGAGGALRVGSAAATVVQPGPDGAGPAVLRVAAQVQGRLDWTPEPTVVARGAAYRGEVRLRCSAAARVAWREVLVLGRVGEGPGTAELHLDAEVDGRPLLRQSTRAGPGAPPGWDGPAGTAGHRVLAAVLLVGERRGPLARHDGGVDLAVLPLEGPGTLVSALGPTTTSVLRALAAAGL